MIIKTKQKSPRKLSFMSIYFLGINGIIGSEIFLLPQAIYKDMDLAGVLVLLFSAVTVSLIALCYADLASRFSNSGAAWIYSYNAFGRFGGFEVGIFVWFMGCCTEAAEIVALLTTLKSFLPVFNNNWLYYSSVFGLIIFLIHFAHFSPVIPKAATTGAMPLIKHFGSAFSVTFYMFAGFSFIPIAAKQMEKPEKNIPRVLVAVMISVTVLYGLVMIVAIGILGQKTAWYSTPIAQAFKSSVSEWGYILIIVGMLISIFGVAFAISFDNLSLISSLASEHQMLPKWIGKKNRYDAPWVAIS